MEEKESVKWLRGYQAACQAAQAGATGLPRAQVLVRAMRERTLVEVRQRVWDWLPKQAAADQGEVNVPAKPGRRARVARLALRFAEVELEPPTNKRRLDRVLEEVQWRVLIAAAGPESAAPEQPPPSNRRYGWGRAWAASWGEKAMGRPECNACGAGWQRLEDIWSSAGNWRALRPNLEAQCPATGMGNDQGFAGGL
jgi:hypothetical protein